MNELDELVFRKTGNAKIFVTLPNKKQYTLDIKVRNHLVLPTLDSQSVDEKNIIQLRIKIKNQFSSWFFIRTCQKIF